MLDQRRAALNPITVIAIEDPVYLANFGSVDVAADHTISLSLARGTANRRFIVGNIFNCVLHFVFQKRRKRPIWASENAADSVEPSIDSQREVVGAVT